MLLVVISLVIGTILTTAYLISRDNSVAIAENIAASAAARSAAVSGLDLGLAIMQTETDWRTEAADGTLFANYSLAGAVVEVQVADFVTGGPPTADSSYLTLTATATVGSVGQTATASAYAPTASEKNTADVDLSEFAVITSGSIQFQDTGTLTRWATAPLTPLGQRINLATQATGASSVVIGANAAALDVTVYHGPGASASLVSNGTGQPIEQVELPDPPPMPDPRDPGVARPSGSQPDYILSNTVDTIAADLVVDDFELRSGAQATLLGDLTVVAKQDVVLTSQSKMVIDGNVKLIAFNDIELRSGSAIELAPGATLTIFVGDDLLVDTSYVGDERPDMNIRDYSGIRSSLHGRAYIQVPEPIFGCRER